MSPGVEPVVDVAEAVPELASDPAVETFRRYVDARFIAMTELDTEVAEHAATSSADRLAFDQDVIRQLDADSQTIYGAPRLLVVGATENGDSQRIILICQWHGSGYFVDQVTGDPVQEVVEEWFPYQVWFVDDANGGLLVDHIYDGEHACETVAAG